MCVSGTESARGGGADALLLVLLVVVEVEVVVMAQEETDTPWLCCCSSPLSLPLSLLQERDREAGSRSRACSWKRSQPSRLSIPHSLSTPSARPSFTPLPSPPGPSPPQPPSSLTCCGPLRQCFLRFCVTNPLPCGASDARPPPTHSPGSAACSSSSSRFALSSSSLASSTPISITGCGALISACRPRNMNTPCSPAHPPLPPAHVTAPETSLSSSAIANSKAARSGLLAEPP